MNWLSYYLSQYYWKCRFSWRILLGSVFVFLGVFVTFIEIATYIYPNVIAFLKSNFHYFIIFGILWSFWETRLKLSFIHQLHNRDILIQVVVGDILKMKGDYVIGSNVTFDTALDKNFISLKSVQGQFTKKYYDNVAHLDNDLEESLKDQAHEVVSDRQTGKKKRYPIGTVAKISPKNQTAYFLAIAEINDRGNATGTYENLKVALARLWDFLINHGNMEPIVVPILGSGFSRINEKREDIIHEIINSFIAACAARKFCEKLVLVIHPKDLRNCNINLTDLDNYTAHICRHTSHKTETMGVGIGTA